MNLFALKILFSKKCIVLDTLDGVTHYKVPENVHMSEIFSDITHSRRVLVKEGPLQLYQNLFFRIKSTDFSCT